MNKDILFTCAKDAYNQMSAFDLDEAGLPHVFDLLTTQQKEFFITFFENAQNNFRELHDPNLQDEFYSNITSELGYRGCDAVEDIVDRMGIKICKF